MALNPQQSAFKEAYMNPNSESFGNALQSALHAGFAQEYAESITAKGLHWVAEIVGDLERLQMAERVLDKTLRMDTEDAPDKMRVQTDVAKFVASRLGRHKYAERQEHTGLSGGPINVNLAKLDDDQLDKLIAGKQAQAGRTPVGEGEANQGEPS